MYKVFHRKVFFTFHCNVRDFKGEIPLVNIGLGFLRDQRENESLERYAIIIVSKLCTNDLHSDLPCECYNDLDQKIDKAQIYQKFIFAQ